MGYQDPHSAVGHLDTCRDGELPECALLELAHPLAADAEALADLTQGLLLAVEAVAGPHHCPLSVRQAGGQGRQLSSGRSLSSRTRLSSASARGSTSCSPIVPTAPSSPVIGSSIERGRLSIERRLSTCSSVRSARVASSSRDGSR